VTEYPVPGLQGRVAIVTGASRGIGLAISRLLAESGVQVMLSSRRLENLEAAARDLPGTVAVFPAHAGHLEDAQGCIDATIDKFGGLDILVNNAATNPYLGPVVGVEPSQFDKTFEVNLRGPLLWTKTAWERALSRRPGVVVNIASTGGLQVEPGLGIYNASKAGLIHMTRQLAYELAPTRVLAIAPGLVETQFSAALVAEFGAKHAQRLPMRRLGQPTDIANLAAFLISDAASWMTGQTLVIDGGASVMFNDT
jgi:NAD(P)-dependent dehydrogenase (short-subunit alcohol dehydrogenase family)